MPARFLTAHWRDLAVLNFACDPQILKPLVPKHCELDDYHGQHYVSLVAFLFLNTKVFGIPIPFHRHFEEINLRFYVKRHINGVWRRGVVFVREIVPRQLIAWVAKTVYNENYIACPTRHRHHKTHTHQSLHYEWDWGGLTHSVSLQTAAEPTPLVANTLNEFILEHYYGYTRQKDGSTSEYEVQHPRWQTFAVHDYQFQIEATRLYGPPFAATLAQKPHSVICAQGSDVAVWRGERLA